MMRRATVTSIGLTPRMSFTAVMIRPGRLMKVHHSHRGEVQNPDMYVIYTGVPTGLLHDQDLCSIVIFTHNCMGTKFVISCWFFPPCTLVQLHKI